MVCNRIAPVSGRRRQAIDSGQPQAHIPSMAAPARTPPAGNRNDEALDILRRLEPTLAQMHGELRQVQADVADIRAEQKEQRRDIGKLQQDVARLDGRVSQLPTLWQLAGLIFAIFGAAFVLIRFASGH